MKENITTGDLIEKLVHQHGIKKKLATELFRAIPEIIEEGLVRDGEVKVKDLGTFRMKWTLARVGRNPKTGERVEIPPHNRLVFLPEQSFKEFINSENRLLSYKVIPDPEHFQAEISIPESKTEIIPEPAFTEPVFPPEPSPPATAQVRKRRIHWIIPTAIAVIAILCVIFYFRTFYPVGSQQSAVGGQQSAVGSQQSPVDGQQSAVDGQQSPVGGQQSPVGGQQSVVDSQQSAVGSQQSPVAGQQSAVDSQQSAVGGQQSPVAGQQSAVTNDQLQVPQSILRSVEGRHLFRMAREEYGNPFLWVLIYRSNLDKIPDPDMVISGREIIIPALEGTPDKLSRNDSLAVSDGYRLVYEYYKSKGDPRASDFFKGIDRYKPK